MKLKTKVPTTHHMAWVMCVLVMLHVIIRGVALVVEGCQGIAPVDYLFRQTIYLLAWLILSIFFGVFASTNVPSTDPRYLFLHQQMKYISLITAIICFIKLVVTVGYILPNHFTHDMAMVSYIVEVLVWLVLTVFMLRFWWRQRKITNQATSTES